MTTVLQPPPVTAAETVRALGWAEAKRFARHPIFVICAVLQLASAAAQAVFRDTHRAPSVGATLLPCFLLGVLGLFVANRLARPADGAAGVLEAAPTDENRRGAGLCLACLVPAAVALVWFGWVLIAWTLWPPDSVDTTFAAVSPAYRVAIMFAAVLAALGGPLLGITVARWWRFPGAALLAIVLLVAAVLATAPPSRHLAGSRLYNTLRLAAPADAGWSSGAPGQGNWVLPGSPVWRLGYLSALCGLAAVAAVLHRARGMTRRRLLIAFAILSCTALTSFGLSVVTGPGLIRI